MVKIIQKISMFVLVPFIFGFNSTFCLEDVIVKKSGVIPDNVLNNTCVKRLIFDQCSFRTVPGKLNELRSLESLVFKDCGLLNDLPRLDSLINLKELRLSLSRINKIPSAIFGLKKLEILDVSKTKIDSVSPDIKKLTSLKKLALNNLKIKNLPSSIVYLKDLEILWIANTNLKELPLEIFTLKKLKVVWADWGEMRDGYEYKKRFLEINPAMKFQLK